MRYVPWLAALLVVVGCVSSPQATEKPPDAPPAAQEPGPLPVPEPEDAPPPAPEPEPPLVRELPLAENTPPALRVEIDRLAAVLVDFEAGADGLDARVRLVEIGRPAVPRVLSAFLHTGDWGTMEGMINACFVDLTLREMVPEDIASRIPPLKPFHQPGPREIRAVVEAWFRWWHSSAKP